MGSSPKFSGALVLSEFALAPDREGGAVRRDGGAASRCAAALRELRIDVGYGSGAASSEALRMWFACA